MVKPNNLIFFSDTRKFVPKEVSTAIKKTPIKGINNNKEREIENKI
jgi:hypothetical protein